jgi:hypothetical protein
MGPAQLKLDYSRVGASVKKIQQKASEENKKAIQKLNALK